MLIVNLEDGLFQWHQREMFWMLKSFDLNEYRDKITPKRKGKDQKRKELNRIAEAYGTSIGPDLAIYFTDHDS